MDFENLIGIWARAQSHFVVDSLWSSKMTFAIDFRA